MRQVAVGALLLALACAGHDLTEEMQAERAEYVTLCFENETQHHVTADVHGKGGGLLERVRVRSFSEARDSVHRTATGGEIHVGLDATGKPRTYYPPQLQGVLVRPELGFRIGSQGQRPFAHSSVIPEGCP